jgi:hypothetical protein
VANGMMTKHFMVITAPYRLYERTVHQYAVFGWQTHVQLKGSFDESDTDLFTKMRARPGGDCASTVESNDQYLNGTNQYEADRDFVETAGESRG